MFAKDKVSKSLIDAVESVIKLDESSTGNIKIPTATGYKVLGGRYGSAQAHRDQTKHEIDTIKGPKAKELKAVEKEKDLPEEVTQEEIDSFAKRLVEKAKCHMKEKKDSIMVPEEVEIDNQINEVLKKDASAGDWIHDFVHSDNPKFAGKSKAERKKMALGAYYAKQNEGYENSADDKQDDKEEAKKAGMTLAQWEKSAKDKKEDKEEAKEKGKEEKGEKESVKEESEELDEATPPKNTDVADKSYLKTMGKKPGPLHNVGKGLKAFLKGKPEPMESVEHDAEKSVEEGYYSRMATDKAEDERLAAAKGSWKSETPWMKTKGDGTVTDKSGAVHTPMSRAKDLARRAFQKVKNETK